MSQSASLYSISRELFHEIEHSEQRGQFDIFSLSKNHALFQGTFCGGIEFVLSKGLDENSIKVIDTIFIPEGCLGREKFDSLPDEKKLEFHGAGNLIPYHDPEAVSAINNFLINISELIVHEKFNSRELNENAIYPEVWHDDNSPDQAFNERHITEDIVALKRIFQFANKEKDYILVYLG